MKSSLLLLLQVGLILCLLYALFGTSNPNLDSKSFEKEFESKGFTFRVQSQPNTPSKENPSTTDPKEPPHHPATEPDREHPSPVDNNNPPRDPPSNEPHPPPPQEPSPEEPSTPPPKDPREGPSSPEPKGDKETKQDPLPDLSSVDWKEIEANEAPLKQFPSANKRDTAPRSKKNDRKKELLCKVAGKGCLRKGPAEELPHLWFILCLYSPNQQKTKLLYEMHNYFVSYVQLYGIRTQVIEVVFPGQNYLATKPNNAPYELQYKSEWAFNMRENLVNVGSKHLPDDWDNIAWVDAHVFWEGNPYWFENLIIELARNNVVHMFRSNSMQGAGGNHTRLYLESVGYLWQSRHTMNFPPARQWGMAWATKREIFEALGGLMDVCIAGKCDLYQAYGYFGQVWTGDCSNPGYAAPVKAWQERAIKVVQKKIGFVPANLMHFEHCVAWEGCQTSSYNLMSDTLINHNFNPDTDLKRDSEGRLEFKGNWNLAKTLWGIYGGTPK